jgi:hypothetical protein
MSNESQRAWLFNILVTSKTVFYESTDNKEPITVQQIFCEVLVRETLSMMNVLVECLGHIKASSGEGKSCRLPVHEVNVFRDCHYLIDCMLHMLCWIPTVNRATSTSTALYNQNIALAQAAFIGIGRNIGACLNTRYDFHKPLAILLTHLQTILVSWQEEKNTTVSILISNSLFSLQQKCQLLQKRWQFFGDSHDHEYKGISSMFCVGPELESARVEEVKIFISHSGSISDRNRSVAFLQTLSKNCVKTMRGHWLDAQTNVEDVNEFEERIRIFELNSLREKLRSCSSAIILLSRDYQKSVLARVEAELIIAEQQKLNSSLIVQFICLDEDEEFVQGATVHGDSWLKQCIGKCKLTYIIFSIVSDVLLHIFL